MGGYTKKNAHSAVLLGGHFFKVQVLVRSHFSESKRATHYPKSGTHDSSDEVLNSRRLNDILYMRFLNLGRLSGTSPSLAFLSAS